MYRLWIRPVHGSPRLGMGSENTTFLSFFFFLYILDETPKEYTAAYDFDKRFVIFFLHVLLCCHITNTVFVVWPGQTLLAIFCVRIGCKKSQVWTSVEKSKDSNSRGENRVPGRGVFSCFFGWKMVASVFFHRKPPGCPG